MNRKANIDIECRQSLANDVDKELLNNLLSQHSNLTKVFIKHRFSQGYSGNAVYLCLPTFKETAKNSWILKVGPIDEISKENEGYIESSGFVPNDCLITKICKYEHEDKGLLIYEYKGSQGFIPLSLNDVLSQVEAFDAVKKVLVLISKWSEKISWNNKNISSLINAWIGNKIDHIPEYISAITSSEAISSPDFADVFHNPLYYIKRGLKECQRDCPFSFQHGDLNLENILFSRDATKSIITESPVIIDFRYSKDDQVSLIDLVKLESCIRYQLLKESQDIDSLQSNISFLSYSVKSFLLEGRPETIANRGTQEYWRCIAEIRKTANQILSQRQNTEILYWALLFSYGISSTTYCQLTEEIKRLNFIDSCHIFSSHIFPQLYGAKSKSNQCIFSVSSSYSPYLLTEEKLRQHQAFIPVLSKAINRGQAVLVIGSNFGKQSGGVPNKKTLIRNVYKGLIGKDPATDSESINFQLLSSNFPKQKIIGELSKHLESIDIKKDVECLLPKEWAMIINMHYHSKLYDYLLFEKSKNIERIDSFEDIAEKADKITAGATAYFAMYGDVESNPESFSFDDFSKSQRNSSLAKLIDTLGNRQIPLSLIFWRCEEEDLQTIIDLKSNFKSYSTVPIDAYYVSEINDSQRDSVLDDLSIWRIDAPLTDIYVDSQEIIKQEESTYDVWRYGDSEFKLPQVSYLTKHLVEKFDHVGMIGTINYQEDKRSFLLGDRLHVSDIQDGRVVRRREYDSKIIPSIKGVASKVNRHQVELVCITGRAGAGVSTAVCYSAYILQKEEIGPVYVVATRASRTIDEWGEAGKILGEVSIITSKTVFLFIDVVETRSRELEALANGVLDSNGALVIVAGGRKELVNSLAKDDELKFAKKIEISDTLEEQDWQSLAGILNREGYAPKYSPEELFNKLKESKHLLPAIYEATDKKNRKFREIVSFEYHRYDNDPFLQRAYRFVCYMGAFNQYISQYWLLKALGNRAISDAARILSALNEDIVVEIEQDNFDSSNYLLGPRHRLIAEEVLNIAVPNISDRLSDIKQLISTCNLSSEKEGLLVAKLLEHKGDLINWVRESITDLDQQNNCIEQLYEVALDNLPINNTVAVYIKQHYALVLRKHKKLDKALDVCMGAELLDPENPATLHILGLVYETRSMDTWKSYIGKLDDAVLAKAYASEDEAKLFFNKLRENRPDQEHGYASEANYISKKYSLLKNKVNEQSNQQLKDLKEKTKFQLFESFSLLKAAETMLAAGKNEYTKLVRTKITAQLGQLDDAMETVENQIADALDPIQKRKLLRVAAGIANESEDDESCIKYCTSLIDEGDHGAWIYIMRDDAIASTRKNISFRYDRFRDSATKWNRQDVRTQLRWIELLCYLGNFEQAKKAIIDVRRLTETNSHFYEKQRIVAVIKEAGPYSFNNAKYTGKVERLLNNVTGYLSFEGLSNGIWFRDPAYGSSQLQIGDEFEYELGITALGFRAINLRPISVH